MSDIENFKSDIERNKSDLKSLRFDIVPSLRYHIIGETNFK